MYRIGALSKDKIWFYNKKQKGIYITLHNPTYGDSTTDDSGRAGISQVPLQFCLFPSFVLHLSIKLDPLAIVWLLMFCHG